MDQICCDKCGRGIDGEQYCGDCMADEVASRKKVEAEVARLRSEREWVCLGCLHAYTYQATDLRMGLPHCPTCGKVCTTKYASEMMQLDAEVVRLREQLIELRAKVERLKAESAGAFAAFLIQEDALLDHGDDQEYEALDDAVERFRAALAGEVEE